MAQHDYNIANQSGADFRADLNNALLAIATVNSGATEPSTTFAHQLWVDTANSVLKIRNAADNAWITTGVSITASNTFTGDLTGNVTGNLTGNVTGNVTGDLTGNADSADILSTARTISLSGDVVGSVSFDGSANVDIDTVVQINSITLGTDTTGDYVESLSGGTGVTVTGGTGEGSTPSIAIGQAVATTDNVTFNLVTATDEFIGDIDGAIRFTAKADEALSKGDVVYVSGVSGNTTTVGKAKADDASKMPAFGMAIEDANANNNLQIVTFGNLTNIDTSNESVGEILYVSTTAGEYTTTPPTGESAAIQNIGKVLRSHAVNGSIKVGGAGRSNATGNLNDGNIFIGNASNQAVTATLDTSIVVENTNLYYTTARANTDFDTRLATKDTGDLTEGSNLYYTTARVNSDFDTRLATKSTTDLAEGTNLYYTSARFDSAFTSKDTDDLSEGTTNLYYTTARFDSAFGNKTTSDLTEGTNLYYTDTRANSAIDTRVTKAFVDALGIQASSVDANSVTLGTDTVGNYVATVTGTANKITVTGSGSESANITLSLPDDVQIADSLTVAGNLTVNGTLTSLDTTNLDIEDNLFQLNAGLTGSPVNDSGMLINRGDQDNGIFMWDESVDKFTLGLTTADGTSTGNITLNSLGTLVANLEGNVTGNVTGDVTGDLTGTVLTAAQPNITSLGTLTGLDVTGTVTADGLTVSGNIQFTDSGSSNRNILYLDGSDNVVLATGTTAGFRGIDLYTNNNKSLSVAESGDISFYDDTGTSQALFWDASAESLGIGTTLPSAPLHITQESNAISGTNVDVSNLGLKIINPQNDNNEAVGMGFALSTVSSNIGAAIIHQRDDVQSRGSLSFATKPALGEGADIPIRMTISSDGNVGIGNSTINTFYDTAVNVYGSSNSVIQFQSSNTGTASGDGFAVGVLNGAATDAYIWNRESSNLLFGTSSSEKMRIDSSGNVGIGRSNNLRDILTLNKSDTTTTFGATTAAIDITNSYASAFNSYSGVNFRVGEGSYNASLASVQAQYTAYSGNVMGELVFGTRRASTTNVTEALRIDSSGNVGIQNTSPSSYYSTFSDLVVGTTGSTGITVVSGTTNSGTLAFGDGTTGNEAYRGYVQYTHSNDALAFGTTGSEAMRIDSSGNLLVGKTYTAASIAGQELRAGGYTAFTRSGGNPLELNRLSSDGTIANFSKDGSTVGSIGTQSARLTIGTGDTGLRFVGDADQITPWNLSTNSTSNGLLDLGNTNNKFKDLYLSGGLRGDTTFKNNAGTTEYGRFDSSGNLLVGTTNTVLYNNTTANTGGGAFIKDGLGTRLDVSRDNTCLTLNRPTTDGLMIDLYKGTTNVGGIGTVGGRPYFSSSAVGIRPTDSQITPTDGSGAFVDNTVDLGRSASRFKDLYLSGGAYLGGTAAANKLDDYEEGTWTPTYVFDIGGGSINYINQSATYTKVGRLVTVSFLIRADGMSSSDYYVRLGGIPFAATNAGQTIGRVGIQNPLRDTFNLSVEGGTTTLLFYATNGHTDYARGDDVNNQFVSGSFTYMAA